MKLGHIFLLGLLLSCSINRENANLTSNVREEIFGKEFLNSEVVSIEILEIEHPMLGNVLKTVELDKNQKEQFLKDFDNLKKVGLRKCFSNYVVRLNLNSDTLRIKVCGDMVSKRNADVYYKLPSERNFLKDYIDQK
ncbi:hypothetical protein [Rufibacter roseus]|uniref:Lipoprotein n=1 Tax=Rufibacter roseus TaxID=1567108 RepID=A0ABW2DMZ7_9BACT|nr:hypothetical protein [Rufibacter roseus]